MRTASLSRTFVLLLFSMGICLASCVLSAAPGNATPSQGLPSTYADFKERCRTAAVTPEGAVKMYFDAVFCYLDPARRAEASKMLRYIMHTDANWEGNQRHVTFLRRLKDPSLHYIFRSFAAGTSPANGYRMSPDAYRLVFTRKDRQQDYIRVFLRSSGADSDRRVWVKQYPDGFWYVINNADTYAKVRDPAVSDVSNSHDADFDVAVPAPQAQPAEVPAPAATRPESAGNAAPPEMRLQSSERSAAPAQPTPTETAVPPATQPQPAENASSAVVRPQPEEHAAPATVQPQSVEATSPPVAPPAEGGEAEMSIW
ncbi:MAG: hypothetical protein SPI23_04470 [Desulfovibrio sp.]|uniref:DUF6935 domain-containing protein n=2 Tax=Desulfovibrionaceae TaxID=194924 RepID=UPI002A91AB98|nr:hypothetical protein [Desulfovibrio sp.]MDY6233913.1 hypothetical protein [Desulfovibrio sp.]